MIMEKIKYRYKTHFVKVLNDIEVCYTDEGNGKDIILFVHGLANYGNVWLQQVEELKKSYRCISIDLPGCGQSSRGNYPYSMLFYSEVVQKFCEAINITNVSLCGHSMGGHISIVTTLRFPTLVKNLILIAPSGFEKFTSIETDIYKNMLKMGNLFFTNESQLVNSLKQSFYKMPESGHKMISELVDILTADDIVHWRQMVDKCISGMLNEQIFDLLKFIQCPVLAIFGEKDALIPNFYFHPTSTKRIGEQACNEIAQSQLVMVPFAGHSVFMENPKMVNGAIENFLMNGISIK